MMNFIEEELNYTFKNKDLLKVALTHPSYVDADYNNERLEFLGDAVLELVISDYLYNNFDLPEGKMTRLRANIVCTESLATAALKLKIGKQLFLGKGEVLSGGQKRHSNLANAFEAIMGAIFLDSNFDTVKKVILSALKDNIKLATEGKIYKDYKSRLQEYVQQNPNTSVKYLDVDATGPEHDQVFTAQVVINGVPETKGKGKTKKEAQQQAAKAYILKNNI